MAKYGFIQSYKAQLCTYYKSYKTIAALPNNQAFPMKEHFAARYVFHTHLQSNAMYVSKDIKVMTVLPNNQAFPLQEKLCG